MNQEYLKEMRQERTANRRVVLNVLDTLTGTARIVMGGGLVALGLSIGPWGIPLDVWGAKNIVQGVDQAVGMPVRRNLGLQR